MKVGHVTFEMWSTFLNLSLIRNERNFPADSFTMSLIDVKGDIRRRAQALFWEAR